RGSRRPVFSPSNRSAASPAALRVGMCCRDDEKRVASLRGLATSCWSPKRTFRNLTKNQIIIPIAHTTKIAITKFFNRALISLNTKILRRKWRANERYSGVRRGGGTNAYGAADYGAHLINVSA